MYFVVLVFAKIQNIFPENDYSAFMFNIFSIIILK